MVTSRLQAAGPVFGPQRMQLSPWPCDRMDLRQTTRPTLGQPLGGGVWIVPGLVLGLMMWTLALMQLFAD